jgi:hypothetical protein
MKWPVFPLLPLLVALVGAVPVGAKLCGDDVDGVDVPCACGDVVASDVVLGDDPVVQAPCPSDGLVVRATGAKHGVTVDLNGKTIRGEGNGTGVWVLYGGPGGARVVSSGGRASIVAFRDGVVAHGIDSLAVLDGVNAVSSGRDGIRIEAQGYEITNAEARDSGRDGIATSGRSYRVSAAHAAGSGRWGFYPIGNDATLGAPGAGLVAEWSKEAGIQLMGMGHHVVDCVANGNGADGVHLYGMHLEVRGCSATHNAGNGIGGMGMDWAMSANSADDNDKNGIVVGGMHVTDQGGNRGSGNRGLNQRRPVSQCEISERPCLP